MSDQTVETMQMFKKLTGRDTVSADVKFEEPVRFENYATLIFACNRMPVLNDDTRGNWRRWLLIDFPNTFEPDAAETRPKEELMAEMTTDAELQGLLARCVEEVRAWDDGRAWFSNAPSWEEARRRIRRAAEPVYDFAHACLADSEDYEPTDKVRRCYRAYAKAEGLPTKSREEFGRQFLNQIDMTVEKKRKRINGSRQQVYEGISFTSRGEQLLQGDVGDEGDVSQSSMGGPRGRAATVVQLADEHADGDGGVSHDMLVGLAVGQGMTPDQAEAAIQKARNQGDLAGTDEYYPT
jgi:putative DNA primase/helicase